MWLFSELTTNWANYQSCRFPRSMCDIWGRAAWTFRQSLMWRKQNCLKQQSWKTGSANRKQLLFLIRTIWVWNVIYCISTCPWHFMIVFIVVPVSGQPSAGAGAARLSVSLSTLCRRLCLAVLRSAVEAAVSMMSVTSSMSFSSSSGCFAWE